MKPQYDRKNYSCTHACLAIVNITEVAAMHGGTSNDATCTLERLRKTSCR